MSWLEALGVFRRAPDARSTAEIEAEVRAEIEHHLACSARELVEQGRTPEQAEVEARQRFGDVERAQGACLRLQTGGRIMLQRIHLAVTLLLFVAVLVLGWSTWEGRRAAARTLEVAAQQQSERFKLGERLAAVLAKQRAREPVEDIVIRVGDELELLDAYNATVHVTEKVAADGKILVPELGWVPVAGLTREEAERALTEALARYFVTTDVKVKVRSAAPDALTPDMEAELKDLGYKGQR